ncbi:hypothetical protein FA15DRAFT_680234 [Coprinopsis marcescibilis]|uniref:Uncharacterized protein n=1 Tax=Coprinopsis marcescibilis TaxID=230819 RepID=A0A5C3KYU6_COPMA|nr:hypothetical protein FA15DRAFT_680234 [Coprinopsis marcescibilis]
MRTDPLTKAGRHFMRTVWAFCQVRGLLEEGIACSMQIKARLITLDILSPKQKREYEIYQRMMYAMPKLEERLCLGSDDDLGHTADLGVVVDWLVPSGASATPQLSRHSKANHGFYHYWTGKLLCPVGLDWEDPKIQEELRSGTTIVSGEYWPAFIYKDYTCDENNIWKGLFQSDILVKVVCTIVSLGSQKATKSCNAVIHNMTSVTIPLLAYIATQVMFSQNDVATDSETFYNLIISLLNNPDEKNDVDALLNWWNG